MPQNSGETFNNLVKEDLAHVWHPFSQMGIVNNIPLVRGKGVYLYDADDNAYLDAISSWWVNIHGHCHPTVGARIKKQLDTLEHSIFAGFTHDAAVDLCKKLVSILPEGINKCFFSDNGSTAVEVGVKMAIQYWFNQNKKKTTILAFRNSYHGDTFGAMSVSERSTFNLPFEPYLFEIKFIDPPYPGNEERSLHQLKKVLAGDDIAAMIYEPLVQGAGGMLMYEAEELDKLLSECIKNEVLLIADEVMTGFGRTGKMFASLHCQTQPDIICISKGLTAGFMPMSITACTDAVYEAFLSDSFASKTFFHGHSYTGNPLGCAAALGSLEVFEQENVFDSIQRIELVFQSFMDELSGSFDNVRQTGTILAFDVKEEASYFSNLRDKIYYHFLSAGILARPLGNTVYFMPPYCIQDNELKRLKDHALMLPKMLG